MGMYFGTRERMTWVKTPAIDAGIGKGRWTSNGTFINGGAYSRSSTTGHKRYTFAWNLASQEEIYNIIDYADGLYGDGVMYFLDPFAKATNVLPQWWAAPRIQAEDAPPLTKEVRPTLVQTAANSNGYPTQSAVYNFTENSVFDEVYVPVPPGEAFHFGAHGSATGTAQILLNPEGAPEPTVEVVTNLIPNPSFETGTAEWQWGSTTGLTSLSQARVVGDAVSGTAFQRTKWEGRNTGTPYFIDNARNVVGGTTYTGSIWVRSSRTTTGRLRMWQYSSAGVATGGNLVSDLYTLEAGVWTRLHFTGTVAATATLIRLSASFDANTIYGPRNLVKDPRTVSAANYTSGAVTRSITADGLLKAVTDGSTTAYVYPLGDAGSSAFYPATPGTPVSTRVEVRNPDAEPRFVRLAFSQYTTTGAGLGLAASGATVTLQPGEVRTIELAGEISHPDAVKYLPLMYIYGTVGGGVAPAGFSVDMTRWATFTGSSVIPGEPVPYFDGTTEGAEWTGTADASASILPHVLEFDAAILTQGSTLYNYFDGSTATQVEYPETRSFGWTSTAHASTSTMTITTDYGMITKPALLGVTTEQLTNLKVENATGVTITGTGIGQLTLAGMIAQVRPAYEPAPTGRFISGRGHSGCRFEDAPTVTGYSAPAALDKVAATATLIETGAWE